MNTVWRVSLFCGTIPWSWNALLDTNHNHVEDKEYVPNTLNATLSSTQQRIRIDTVMNN